MSTYDDASLVMIPSGYKTGTVFSQKPMSTSGQLTFTRSNDTATRVGPDGLIEKVRTNLVLQSNTFSNAAWTKTRSSIVADSVANPIDGAVNASTLLDTTDNNTHLTFQSFTATANPYTFSVYAKAAGVNWIQMRFDNGSALQFVYFNLSTGSIGSATSASGKITSLGNGWYRCSVTATATATSFFSVVHLAEADNDNSFAGTGTNGVYLYAAQTELGDIATAYIPTTTAAVSVGPVANVPRLDYLNSSCPRLLLEPQRTNLVTYSEQFNNASWGKTGVTITANNTTAPDGTMSADLITATATTSEHGIGVSPTLLVNTPYSISIFVKAGTYNFINVGAGSSSATAWFKTTFDLSNGTFVAKAGANGTNLSSSIQNLGNGYFRISVTGQISVAGNFITFDLASSASPTFGSFGINSFTATGSESLFIWGAQLEAGSYVSSYIPSLGAAVTRGADLAQKTSATALIGQAEGVLFVDFVMEAPEENRRFSLSDGTTSNRILIGQTTSGNILFYTANIGAAQVSFTTSTSYTKGTRLKIAFAYKENDFTGYINGEQIFTDSLGTVPSTTKFSFSEGSDSSIFIGSINQALLFKTRLPNSELASLTTL